jgi:hypothetical protein
MQRVLAARKVSAIWVEDRGGGLRGRFRSARARQDNVLARLQRLIAKRLREYADLTYAVRRRANAHVHREECDLHQAR